VIEISFEDITQTIAKVDQSIIVLEVLKTLLVCLALYVLIRHVILERLTRLIQATRRIAKGDYDISLPEMPRDEIAQLAASLNRMSADLRKSREVLDEYNRHLENMVREKTAALQQTYEDLKNAQGHLVLNEKMASLGVLIAGIAHEINTPVGAILNVSRNLARMLATLPQSLVPFWRGEVSSRAMTACLGDLRSANTKTGEVSSYRDAKRVEDLLVELGSPRPDSLHRARTAPGTPRVRERRLLHEARGYLREHRAGNRDHGDQLPEDRGDREGPQVLRTVGYGSNRAHPGQ
jgi:HAMP domain-containing protein